MIYCCYYFYMLCELLLNKALNRKRKENSTSELQLPQKAAKLPAGFPEVADPIDCENYILVCIWKRWYMFSHVTHIVKIDTVMYNTACYVLFILSCEDKCYCLVATWGQLCFRPYMEWRLSGTWTHQWVVGYFANKITVPEE